MGNKLMTGVWRYIVGVPPILWERQFEKAARRVKRSTRFMSDDHRRVHHYVVRELPRVGKPISPDRVARDLSIAKERAEEILGDLERHLTFVSRNDRGEVTWAYPVTVETTPHELSFQSGEKLHAA
jgi:uncharacterized membrane-anchored protein